MATSNDIKNGTVLRIDGQLWTIIEFQHVKPGKGGSFVRTKMKNVLSGKVVDKTFNAGIKVETANVDRRDFQYLYMDGEGGLDALPRLLEAAPALPVVMMSGRATLSDAVRAPQLGAFHFSHRTP